MPILRLNAGPDGLTVHISPAPALPALRHAASGTGPIIVMVHGFKYDPSQTISSPHSTIFALRRRPDRSDEVLWPRHLGFGLGHASEGLCIAFGWRARGHLWAASRSARGAGVELAKAIRILKDRAPHRPLHIITHSMGSDVAFRALHDLHPQDVSRFITLTGASYQSTAKEALTTPAGRHAQLFNVVSRENDLFDLMFERLMPSHVSGDSAIGKGISAQNAVNIQLDCPLTLHRLTGFGAQIASPARRMCHWSGYMRGGAMAFYADLMRQPDHTPFAAIKAALPATLAPRWSRFAGFAPFKSPLPELQNATS